ncbi:hypothetical protein ACUNWD_15755 [Sunxiuqinia sp. A32]|uniref:hypothetical protein n=1 Tax=Sunxiuqinia sp. A32 TaxID=3461496 RepID=UPI0040460937
MEDLNNLSNAVSEMKTYATNNFKYKSPGIPKKVVIILFLISLSLSSISQTNQKSIVVLVDSQISNGIAEDLNIFKTDLESENYHVILKTNTFQSPEEIREYFQFLYTSTSPSLVGAILMGKIPLARQHFVVTYLNPDLSPTTHNCLSTQFYSDLNGNFYKNNPQYPESYSKHDGDTISEIWVSVLPYYKSIHNTITQINQYLKKNHAYRHGNIDIQDGFIEVNEHYNADNANEYEYLFSSMSSGQFSWTPFTEWGNVGLYFYNSIGEPDVAFAYEEELKSNKYTFAALTAHGSYYTNGELSIPEIQNMTIKPIFVWLGGCNTGNLDYEENIAIEITYSSLSNALVTKGGTSNVGGLGNNENGFFGKNIATAMLEGKSIGEAYLYHNHTPLIYPWSIEFEMHYATPIFFGDLSLTLNQIASTSEILQKNAYLDNVCVPNPLTNYTTIYYSVPKSELVEFIITDETGRRILHKEINSQAGSHSFQINTGKWQNGIHFLTMRIGSTYLKTIKLLKIK